MSTAIVLGATGAIGQHLVTQLSRRNEVKSVIVITRRELDVAREFPHAIASKLQPALLDFERLEAEVAELLPAGAVAFVALGTTKKQAGSKEAFRRVDHGLVLAFARACKTAEVSRLGVVTAHGANARSSVFYNRVKGEVEQDIQALGLPCVFFARPSLLLGRPEDGRLAETWASALLAPASRWLPRSVRPIEVRVVAAAMVDSALGSTDGRASFVLSNAAMHQGESAQR
ncbi:MULTISPECIES: NAD(P)H-binding protein [unclassified Halomonas]|uniref:NAD(P)H-binding protein n=1 Tax=unclassified Halomonas TaxID=2609666 RepID=UPI001EF5E321|nr:MULTISPECIES: NAD(P)H-binding protein [unclassified Halomonas]MCG7578002.1 NAD(P)H-binding protein [Halomonas sp. MMH1-48]MCG7605007.1 NAD(P)H-binding protein [Halomonas sp. MM17-34]MCG7614224.1 NAD(P)H-binding protein [Halomonas sp. MM17-29]MCG7621126.1 NAD(P)H-binding protein [Halomonas sp. DSH1-27]